MTMQKPRPTAATRLMLTDVVMTIWFCKVTLTNNADFQLHTSFMFVIRLNLFLMSNAKQLVILMSNAKQFVTGK